MQSGHRSPGHITMNIIIDIYVFTFPPSNLTLLQWDPSSSSSSSSNPNFMFLHNLSNVCWHLSPVIANSNHLGWCACIFSSCCQSNPQRIRCQWNTHSKSITCTINYGCRSECYSIRVLDYKHTHTHTHTHTHSHTQTHTQTHTKSNLRATDLHPLRDYWF